MVEFATLSVVLGCAVGYATLRSLFFWGAADWWLALAIGIGTTIIVLTLPLPFWAAARISDWSFVRRYSIERKPRR